ncbi:biotin attachment protein [Rhodobacteraceae bacterium (ex Bugula neritina AB1)]|nr:biotin attachment protein [Rhodobacteraceae bacterium (ex Bugula neritina AB1)]
MKTNITIPTDLWEEDEQCTITVWLASDGANVTEGALIAEIMAAKVQHEIEAPASGTLTILKETEVPADKGEVIGFITS